MVDTGAVISWSLDATAVPAYEPIVLDAEQRAVVDHRRGPLLVLAGPGTGKTATIVEAVAARMGDVADPLPGSAILVLTFGRRAAIEVRDRIMRRLGADAGLARSGLPTVATFHSYAYALMAEAAVSTGDAPPRLLSGAEEDVRIRELLAGGIEDGTIDWPADLLAAVPTLGLANEIRAVLARARALNISGDDLRRLGRRADRPAWAAIGDLAVQDEQVMLLENVCDYAELLHRAVLRLAEPDVQRRIHGSIKAIYVDEYQDTDPLQVAMLHRLVGPNASLVVVGDPDQAIYGFRGASVDALLDFPHHFPRPDGRPASVITLQTTRRFGPAIREAATAVLRDRPITSRGSGALDAEALWRHRHPVCVPDIVMGDVRVESFDAPGTRAAWVADQIRAAHVRDGVPWSQMAVLVRGGAQIPALQRALSLVGIPVSVAAEEIPLRAEPAVAVLLRAAGAALDPSAIDDTLAMELLTGPMGGLDARGVRRLGRALRAAHRLAAPDEPVPTSDELIGRALRGADRSSLAFVDVDVDVADDVHAVSLAWDPQPVAAEWTAVVRLRELLATAHAQVTSGAQAPEVLWTLWQGAIGTAGPLAGQRAHGWPERLRSAALAGSRAAHHDLDAILALFDTAERAEGRYGGVRGMRNVLAALRAQQIPAEPVVERGIISPGVRLLTAHRAKGLEWRRVWIAGAEEGTWPDLRSRGSVLQPDRLNPQGLGPAATPADLLAEERRLFYVAMTRARESVVVTTIEDPGDSGSQPSRFIADLGLPVLHRVTRPEFPASLPGLVAELRAVVADPASAAGLRDAAVERLAMLATQQDDQGAPLVRAADPDSWWGVHVRTPGAQPVRRADQPIKLSGSGLESLTTCSLRWFLDKEVRAQVSRPQAMMFGSIIHSIAEYVGNGQVPEDLDAMDELVGRVWHELRFEAAWQSNAERAQARGALRRFLAYHVAAQRELVGVETAVRAQINAPVGDADETNEPADRHPATSSQEITVDVEGYIDRIEKDEHGRFVAIDLKNMKSAPSGTSIPEHAQLGVYQLLLRETMGEPGGAALVQLRVDASRGSVLPKVQEQPALADIRPTWVEQQLGAAAQVVRTETFVAQPGPHCERCDFTMLCPTQADGQQVVP